MIGYLVWKNGGWRIRYYEEEINGVHILRAEVPGTPPYGPGGPAPSERRWRCCGETVSPGS